ncbi:hypothetical protein ACFL0Y_00445 [Patescibacteria group bacterium]
MSFSERALFGLSSPEQASLDGGATHGPTILCLFNEELVWATEYYQRMTDSPSGSGYHETYLDIQPVVDLLI